MRICSIITMSLLLSPFASSFAQENFVQEIKSPEQLVEAERTWSEFMEENIGMLTALNNVVVLKLQREMGNLRKNPLKFAQKHRPAVAGVTGLSTATLLYLLLNSQNTENRVKYASSVGGGTLAAALVYYLLQKEKSSSGGKRSMRKRKASPNGQKSSST